MDYVSGIHDLTPSSVAQIHQMGRQNNHCRHCKTCEHLGPGESICMAKCLLDNVVCESENELIYFWECKTLTLCVNLYIHSEPLVSASPFGLAPVSSTVLCVDLTPLYYTVIFRGQRKGTVFSDPLHFTEFDVIGNTVKYE